jgi:hypothetical protein
MKAKYIITSTLAAASIAIATVGFAPTNSPTPPVVERTYAPAESKEYICPRYSTPTMAEDSSDSEYKHCSCGIGVYLPHTDDDVAKCTYCGKVQL